MCTKLQPIPLACALLAACSGGGDGEAPPVRSTSPSSLVLAERVAHLGVLAREPMFVEHPSGTLFVSGYGAGIPEGRSRPGEVPTLWRSDDRGASWLRVDVGTAEDGALGNSDVDLAVAPDGTLYFATMGYDRNTSQGTHVAIGVSRDGGASWSWTELSRDRFDDRPWVEVTPDGTAHAIWNDGDGVCHASSGDGGRTWTEHERIHPHGGSSHLAAGPNGELAVRIGPLSASGNRYDEGVDLVAVSTDGGATWEKHDPPGDVAWPRTIAEFEASPRWVEPLAWADDGRLYHLWSDGRALWLGRSDDGGATWEKWQVAGDGDRVFFPYLAARGAGTSRTRTTEQTRSRDTLLAASWFSGRGEELRVHVACIDAAPEDGPQDAPSVVEADPYPPESWTFGPEPSRDTAGEYIVVGFLSSGGLAMVTPVQDGTHERWGFTWWRFELR